MSNSNFDALNALALKVSQRQRTKNTFQNFKGREEQYRNRIDQAFKSGGFKLAMPIVQEGANWMLDQAEQCQESRGREYMCGGAINLVFRSSKRYLVDAVIAKIFEIYGEPSGVPETLAKRMLDLESHQQRLDERFETKRREEERSGLDEMLDTSTDKSKVSKTRRTASGKRRFEGHHGQGHILISSNQKEHGIMAEALQVAGVTSSGDDDLTEAKAA